FRIHFPAQYEPWAERVASDIEPIRAAVVREVGFAPEQVTDVVIANPIADANGITLPLLNHPRIVLFTEPPAPESQIGEFRTWIDVLVAHEMTHLVHLLRPSRNPTKRMIARVLPLNPITLSAPRWVLEGYATVVEGRLTGSGRPASSIRAAILRKWAESGRLPSYGELDSSHTFMGMSMAYLAGSAYLEWLDARGGPGSLQHLWARLTARQPRNFDEAFIGVFGDSPAKLYDRFTAELTERAMAIERESPRVEGELWQETPRDSGEPAVSPDGTKLAFVQRDAKGKAKLVVLPTGPNPEEKKFRERIETMLKRDPQDVAPVITKPFPRKPLHTLTPIDGGDVTNPRWTRDGKSILYTHKQPDREGFLHHDLFLWTPGGANRRVTHLGDVEDGDPLPGGSRAIAVRNRYGFSQLVYVDISSGEVTPYNEPSLDRIDSHPRAAADGRIAWAENDGSGWHVRVSVGAGKEQSVGATLGAFSPEWSGTHLIASIASGGFIDLARIDNGVEYLTRTNGAAVDPAPSSDGSIYFMSLEPDGFVIRHLAAPEPAPARPMLETKLAPAIPPVLAGAPALAGPSRLQPEFHSRAYGFGRQEFRVLAGGAWTAYQHFGEAGVRMGDLLGRIDALAIAGGHNAALAATWRGLPVELSGSLFALRDSNQTNREPPATNRGLELHANYEVDMPLTIASFEAGALAGSSSRGFVDAQLFAHIRESDATARVAFDSDSHARASLRAATSIGGIGLALSGEAARNMSVGGVISSATPDALLIERVIDPALPPGFAELRTYRGARAEVRVGSVRAFWQRHSGAIDVRGLETSMSAPPIPLLGIPSFDVTAGAARVRGLRGTKAWINLRWRP
ncbi:MAG TPA: hypothetical protein VL284_16075, partial [Thermoanaerobaculia bacterium]|nr:hypothetical protein [Thermoanaerobaculia bacterium]